jgi:hypothetical protein
METDLELEHQESAIPHATTKSFSHLFYLNYFYFSTFSNFVSAVHFGKYYELIEHFSQFFRSYSPHEQLTFLPRIPGKACLSDHLTTVLKLFYPVLLKY